MGRVIGGISSGVGGIGGVRDAIGGIAGSIHIDGTNLAPILQNVMGNLNATLSQVEQLGTSGPFSGMIGDQLLKAFQSDLARLAYIAALEKAVNKARGQGSFNIETAINDLWLALDAIKRGQQSTSAPVQDATALMTSISDMLQHMHDSAGQLIQNMR